MIAGLIIRQFKTFKNQTYIPLLDNGNLTGIVGINGVGKSSIMESLDCLFNKKPWNLHVSARKSGSRDNSAYIVPIFIIEKSHVPPALQTAFAGISDSVTDLTRTGKTINSSHRGLFDSYKLQMDFIRRNFLLADYFVIPIGINSNQEAHSSFFGIKDILKGIDSGIKIGSILDFFLEHYQYIYIPKDITPEQFSQIENEEVQKLMGLTLEGELSEIVPGKLVDSINGKLNELLSSVSSKLIDYEYRTPNSRQQNLKKSDLHKLIIKAFFSIRILHKKFDPSWLPINQLSTGEKAKSLLDVAERLITHDHDAFRNNLIIAVDEPEASLHISACFGQFERIESIAKHCRQVIFATHWYGFLSTINSGTATIISRPRTSSGRLKDAEITDDLHKFDLVDLRYFREQIKQTTQDSKGSMPHDIRLKGVNDLIQSIVSSVTLDSDWYNWLICEGSTEQLYFKHFLSEHYGVQNLKIVPVGGASEVKKIYQHLSIIFEDLKGSIKGKVVMLSDTDDQLVEYPVVKHPNLICNRFVSGMASSDVLLVNPASNPKSPSTCIEDILDVDVFMKVLQTSYSKEEFHQDFVKNNYSPYEVCFALDLRNSQKIALTNFFKREGVKYDFAKAYVQASNPEIRIPRLFTALNAIFKAKIKA